MPIPSHLLRPVTTDDFDQVFHLVGTIGDGLTSLPRDPDFIAHRIDDSLRAFDPRIHKAGGETYLFVLEELASGKIIGTSGLLSRVGGFDPFYTYEIRAAHHNYAPMHIHTERESLHLSKNHKGPTEICSLFLDNEFRAAGLGKLLSLPRFCFIKSFPDRFDSEVLAELRGYIDASGKSPFWEAVGSHFFQHDYYTADILSGLGEKEFIEVLMPEHPIYVSLLPESARTVIGKVHPHTEPARRILVREGFQTTRHVDIFDAGPILTAKRDELQTWKSSRLARASEGTPDPKNSIPMIVTNQSLDFRAVSVSGEVLGKDELVVSSAIMEALHLRPGDMSMYLPLDTK